MGLLQRLRGGEPPPSDAQRAEELHRDDQLVDGLVADIERRRTDDESLLATTARVWNRWVEEDFPAHPRAAYSLAAVGMATIRDAGAAPAGFTMPAEMLRSILSGEYDPLRGSPDDAGMLAFVGLLTLAGEWPCSTCGGTSFRVTTLYTGFARLCAGCSTLDMFPNVDTYGPVVEGGPAALA